MIPGVANVRTNFYRGSLIDTPTGWLFNQKRGLLMFLESYRKSFSNNLKVNSRLFNANELDESVKLNNLILHLIECACETLDELVLGGWQIVTSKFQKS